MHQLLSNGGSKPVIGRIVPTTQMVRVSKMCTCKYYMCFPTFQLRQSLHGSEQCEEVEELSTLLRNSHVQVSAVNSTYRT